MRQRRASEVAENGARWMFAVLFCAVLLASTLLLAARTEAQETTAEQTVAQTKEVTTSKVKAEKTTAKPDGTATDTATKNENTVAQYRNAFSDEPEQAVQQSAQQAQADPTEDDGSETATRAATTPQGQPASITDSTSDPDTIVDRIFVSIAGCEVASDASVVIEDDDGTRVRLTNGQNVTITPDDDTVTIVGTESGGNLTDLNQVGGTDPNFNIGDGTILRASGITCDGDDGDNRNDDDGKDDDTLTTDDGCTTLRLFTGDERVSETFGIPDESTGRLRVVYSTLNEDGELTISVGTVTSRASGLNETISGAESGVIRGNVDEVEQIAVSLDPTDQDYRVVFESIGGDDECTTPGDVRGVLTDSVPDDDLPDTGGVPVSVFAGGVALLLAGTAVVGTAVRRRR